MSPARKYEPLLRYLAALPPDQQTVTLTFAELEQLLQFPLPASAWTDAYWATSAVARKYWQPQGFTATLARGTWRVTFTRRVP
jgi:hypothetical protein